MPSQEETLPKGFTIGPIGPIGHTINSVGQIIWAKWRLLADNVWLWAKIAITNP